MKRSILLLAIFGFFLAGCATEEKQWYKPGVNYTMAEFQRDQAACTKGQAVDEDCLRARGWVTLTPDKNTIQPMKGGLQTQNPNRYGVGAKPNQ